MRRFLLLLVMATTLTVVPSVPARACSCSPVDAAQALRDSDGAFIGRLVLREEVPPSPDEPVVDGIRNNPFRYRFRVDETLKATFPSEVDVRSGEGGGDCGISPAIGESVGLLVDRWRGELTSSVCAQFRPDRLRRAAAPVPLPEGRPPPRLLVGTTYGGGRVLSLDDRGRVIAFGAGQGQTTVLALCPGAERVVEAFVPPESSPMRDAALAVRRVSDLAIEREIPLSGSGPADGVYREVEALTCRDPAAGDLIVFVREDSPDYRSRIDRVRGTKTTTLWEGTATHGAIHPNGRLAYVTGGRQGADLVALDLTANPVTKRRVATIPEYPAPPSVAASGKVAVLTGGAHGLGPHPGPLALITIDPSSGNLRRVTVPGESPSGTVVWAPDGRLVFVPDNAAEPVRVYDENLDEVAMWRGWQSSRAVVADGELVGLDQGIVHSSPLEGGPVVTFAELGDGLPGAIAPVAAGGGAESGANAPATEPTTSRGGGRRDGSSGVTIAALAAVLLAGAVLAVHSSSERKAHPKQS